MFTLAQTLRSLTTDNWSKPCIVLTRIKISAVVLMLLAMPFTGCQKAKDPQETEVPHSTTVDSTGTTDAENLTETRANRNLQTATSSGEVVAAPPPVKQHPSASKFTAQQLSKDHTLFVLAFDSITRQTYFLSNYRSLMEDHQVDLTRDLVDSYEPEFARLRNERQKILENAMDDVDVATMLKNNRIDTLLLSRKIRRGIHKTILTREQQLAHQADVKIRRENKKRREEQLPGPKQDQDKVRNPLKDQTKLK